MLGLYAETSIHAGTGQNIGVIDLPIQREAHTGWPCIFGSGMKGALRDRAENRHYEQDKDWVLDAFGPSIAIGGVENAGAFLISDARLLLMPMRSLTTHFKWVTCPAIIHRFYQDECRFLGKKPDVQNINSLDTIDDDKVIVVKKSTQNHVHLNEFRFQIKENDSLHGFMERILLLMGDVTLRSSLEQRLTVVSDDMFSHLCRATPVTPHIRLDSHKTVVDGALWFEESLPSDTLLYCGISATDTRRPGSNLKASDLLKNLEDNVFPASDSYLQVGGNETVGMGWCRVSIVKS